MAERKKFTVEEARQIGEQIGIDWSSSPFDAEQFRMGMDVELEHGLHDGCPDRGLVAERCGGPKRTLKPPSREPSPVSHRFQLRQSTPSATEKGDGLARRSTQVRHRR